MAPMRKHKNPPDDGLLQPGEVENLDEQFLSDLQDEDNWPDFNIPRENYDE